MSQILNINAPQFETEVLKSPVPVLVDFWAPWCAPCQMMGPVLEEVAKSLGDKAKIVKIDVDHQENGALAQQYRIMSIPNMKVFKGGTVVEEFIGMRSGADLMSGIEKHV